MNGADLAVSSLVEEGVRYAFGLPGTSEMPLIAAIHGSEVKYRLCLHEAVAVGMADGYSRARSDMLAIACTHATQGTLNAIGSLRASMRDRVPTLLLAGVAGTGYSLNEPNHHMVGMGGALSPITKWVWQTESPRQISQMIHRGITIARTGTPGPAAMLIPQDFLEAENDGVVVPRVWDRIKNDGYPSNATIEHFRRLIEDASKPVVIAGGTAAKADCVAALVAFANRCRIRVVAESVDRGPMVQPYVFPMDHEYFMGYFAQRDSHIMAALDASDLVILIGTKTNYRRAMGEWLAAAKIVQVDPSAWEIGKNHDLALGIVGDPAAVLRSVIDGWHPERTRSVNDGVLQPSNPSSERQNTSRSRHSPQLLPAEVADVVAARLTPDNVLVDDSQSFGGYLKSRLRFTRPERIFGSLSSHLGWGLPASLGVQLARPEERVIAVISDGSLMLSVQALWTAVKYWIPVLIILINNGGFISLRQEMKEFAAVDLRDFTDLQLDGVRPDYVALASGFGLNGMSARNEDELHEGFERYVSSDGPFLLNVIMSEDETDWRESWFVPPTSTL